MSDISSFSSVEGVVIVPFTSEYREDFRALNFSWIEEFFSVEDADRKVLDDPEGYVLDRGGDIFVALLGEEVVDVCALVKMDDENYDFELAKMTVKSSFRAMGIGYTMGRFVLSAAKGKGATRIYLETNSKLSSAIRLYEKLGFQIIDNMCSPYERCDVQMGISL